MTTEWLLTLIAALLIVALWLTHTLLVEPGLRRAGLEPRGVADVLAHRDWRRYRRECEGSTLVFILLWGGYLSVLVLIVFQVMLLVMS